jgi:hypothetical protein
MSMTKVFLGLAALPFLTGAALAAPAQLTDQQMDKIAAGSDFYELTPSNTAVVVVAVHERSPNTFGPDTTSSSAHPLGITTCVNITATCGAVVPVTNPSLAGTNNIGGAITPGGGSPYYLLINNYALSVGAAFR